MVEVKNMKRGFTSLLSLRNFAHVAEQVQNTVRKMSSASKIVDLLAVGKFEEKEAF
jgi:uncharacterized pyridoxal phosphate-containing UPF0001 family protein